MRDPKEVESAVGDMLSRVAATARTVERENLVRTLIDRAEAHERGDSGLTSEQDDAVAAVLREIAGDLQQEKSDAQH